MRRDAVHAVARLSARIHCHSLISLPVTDRLMGSLASNQNVCFRQTVGHRGRVGTKRELPFFTFRHTRCFKSVTHRASNGEHLGPHRPTQLVTATAMHLNASSALCLRAPALGKQPGKQHREWEAVRRREQQVAGKESFSKLLVSSLRFWTVGRFESMSERKYSIRKKRRCDSVPV